ncbi:MAG: transcription antitermination factor NusB [Anaerolineae bacterium]|jgi:transcription antitermination protein NusB|nr:transcription antitermination factor NusB [Anaerolineae bacterium]MBT7074448.1 transcription antitermination factor NusB [Anaerolineae bacterium]MBT7781941.1 transcription antitermination factor NusB [Anaerolineae bacterium]
MKERTRARSLALQVLYEVDLSDHLPGNIFTRRLQEVSLSDNEERRKSLEDFAHQIIFGILPLTEKLDTAIADYAPDWPLDQIAPIDRNILRIAFWEFGISKKTPIKVAINEAVELAKIYGSDGAPSFINGVLGSLAAQKNEIFQSFKGQ